MVPVAAEHRNRLRVYAQLLGGGAIWCISLLHHALPLTQLFSELFVCQRTVLVVGSCDAPLHGIRAAVQIRLPVDVAHLPEHLHANILTRTTKHYYGRKRSIRQY